MKTTSKTVSANRRFIIDPEGRAYVDVCVPSNAKQGNKDGETAAKATHVLREALLDESGKEYFKGNFD